MKRNLLLIAVMLGFGLALCPQSTYGLEISPTTGYGIHFVEHQKASYLLYTGGDVPLFRDKESGFAVLVRPGYLFNNQPGFVDVQALTMRLVLRKYFKSTYVDWFASLQVGMLREIKAGEDDGLMGVSGDIGIDVWSVVSIVVIADWLNNSEGPDEFNAILGFDLTQLLMKVQGSP